MNSQRSVKESIQRLQLAGLAAECWHCFLLVMLVLSCLGSVGCQFEDGHVAQTPQPKPSRGNVVAKNSLTPEEGVDSQPTPSGKLISDTKSAPDSKATPAIRVSAKKVQSAKKSMKKAVGDPARTLSANSNVIHRRGKQYHKGQLHYNLSTGLLVFEADIRARRIIKKYLPYMSQEQVERAVDLAKSYDPDFQRLRRERAKILANGASPSEVAEDVLNNQLDIIDLVASIRLQIATEVMTEEQIKTARADFQKQSTFK